MVETTCRLYTDLLVCVIFLIPGIQNLPSIFVCLVFCLFVMGCCGGNILPQLQMTTFKLVSTKGDMHCFLGSVSYKMPLAPKWQTARWSLNCYRKMSIKLLELFCGVSLFLPLKSSQLYFYPCYIYPKLIGSNMYSLVKGNTLVKNIFQVGHDDTPL